MPKWRPFWRGLQHDRRAGYRGYSGGWALVVVVVLALLAAALVRSERLLILVIVDIEVLLLFWVGSMWWATT
jgi:hypothetical protein